jgi:hypothetical protein
LKSIDVAITEHAIGVVPLIVEHALVDGGKRPSIVILKGLEVTWEFN